MLEASTHYDESTDVLGLQTVSEIMGSPYISASGKSVQVSYVRQDNTGAKVKLGDREYPTTITQNVSVPFKTLKARDLQWCLENLPRKVEGVGLVSPKQFANMQAKKRKVGTPTAGPVIGDDAGE